MAANHVDATFCLSCHWNTSFSEFSYVKKSKVCRQNNNNNIQQVWHVASTNQLEKAVTAINNVNVHVIKLNGKKNRLFSRAKRIYYPGVFQIELAFSRIFSKDVGHSNNFID